MDKLNQCFETITNAFKTHFDSALCAIYFYGPPPTHIKSDPQAYLVVTKPIPTHQLALPQKALKPIRNYPIQFSLLTEPELARSADVFPLEFLDMKIDRNLLYGTDQLDTLDINDQFLRHECEFYLRSHILKLREAAIYSPSNHEELIRQSLPAFIRIFRFLLYLHDKTALTNHDQIITSLASKIEFDPTIFQIAKGAITDWNAHFNLYVDTLVSITKHVDQLYLNHES